MANLSTEGEACRNEADGVNNGRRRRALAKGLTRKHGVRGAAPYHARVWRIFLLLFFLCKKYDKPAAEASRKARKNYWQRVGLWPAKILKRRNETDVVERRNEVEERSTEVIVKERGIKLAIEHR